MGPRLEQSERQRSQARTYLEDDIMLAHVGEPHDSADGVGVDDEVLAPPFRRPDVVALDELTDRRRSEHALCRHSRQRLSEVDTRRHEKSRGPHTGQGPAPDRV